MSFSSNPFTMMELIVRPPAEIFDQLPERVRAYWESKKADHVDVYCSSCGAQNVAGEGKDEVFEGSDIYAAKAAFWAHVRKSHQYEPQNMIDHGWSWEV